MINNVCILGANFATGNLGVGALAMGTIKCVNYAHPKARIFIMDYSVRGDMYHCRVNDRVVDVPLVNIRYSWKLFLPNNIVTLLALAFLARIAPGERLGRFIIRHNRCLRELRETDLVASLAGGDRFSDIYGFGRFIYVILPQFLALLIGRKLVQMPQTIGPFQRRFARTIAKQIVRHSYRILSRDQESISDLALMAPADQGEPRPAFCYDLGFILDPVRPASKTPTDIEKLRKDHGSVCGINISGLLMMGGYTHKNMFELETDYRDIVFDVVNFILSHKTGAVLLVPHVLGKSAESDETAIVSVLAEMRTTHAERLYSVSGAYDQNGIKYIIGMCDFFIGSRMHACIAALSQAVPTIGIAYSRKFWGVMKSIGMEGLWVDPRSQNPGEILRRIRDAMDNRAQIREALEKMIPSVKKSVLELFNTDFFNEVDT